MSPTPHRRLILNDFLLVNQKLIFVILINYSTFAIRAQVCGCGRGRDHSSGRFRAKGFV